MTKRTRLKIDAGLKAKIALEALREQKSMADLAQRCEAHPTQIYAWKKHVQEQATRAFDTVIVQMRATLWLTLPTAFLSVFSSPPMAMHLIATP